MVVKSGGNWKRPVNRMYTYNFQIGENYYLPMTSYLETKTGTSTDIPGPLCFSERISLHPLSGTSLSVYEDQSVETIKKTRQVISNIITRTRCTGGPVGVGGDGEGDIYCVSLTVLSSSAGPSNNINT